MIRPYEDIDQSIVSEELYHHIVMYMSCILQFYNHGRPNCSNSYGGTKCDTCPLSNAKLSRLKLHFALKEFTGCKSNLAHIINIIGLTNPELIFEELL